ncbi:MAG: hypothetical protein ACOH5I_22100 [Oligoflexus sp.]
MKQFLLAISFLCFACNPMDNTPELVEGLRAFGVGTSEAAYTYSTDASVETIELTFYLASNLEGELEVEDLSLEPDQLQLSDMVIPTPEEYSRLRVFKVQFTSEMPRLEDLQFPEANDTASVSYAMKFNQGGEEELVRGRIKVYRPEKSNELRGLGSPVVDIVAPLDASQLVGEELTLKAEVSNPRDEATRLSWLVAEGKIERPRAAETEWKDVGPGSQTIIVTVRGLDSWNFHYDVVDIVR